MLSVKQLLQLIAIILLLSVMFLYLNVSNRSSVSPGSANMELEVAPVLLNSDGQPPDGGEEDGKDFVTCYVVYSGGDRTEEAIYDNVRLILRQMKLTFQTKRYVAEGELKPDTLLIFCNTLVNEDISEKALADYIRQGGRALFAAGLPEGYAGAYLYPLQGIVEKGNRLESRNWHILEGAMPSGDSEVVFPEFQASTRLKLDQEAVLLIEDEKEKIPIIYQRDYGEGRSVIINGTLMEYRCSGGVFAAALGAAKGELLYPVLGTLTVFLENYPFLMPGYDKVCVNSYGRNAENFERDVLWPELVSEASKYGLRYTMNLLEPQDEMDDDQLNSRLFNFLVKENLRYDGEIMLTQNGRADAGRQPVQSLLRLHFPNYKPQAYGAPVREGTEASVLRGVYQSNGILPGQDYSWDGERVGFPVLSSGFSGEECNFNYLSGLALFGAVSHSLPAGGLIYDPPGTEEYTQVRKEMAQLFKSFGRASSWLEPATITEAAGNVIAYTGIRFRAEYAEGFVRGSCSNFNVGQSFLLRTGREIDRVEGGEAVGIARGFYLIKAAEPGFTVYYANGKERSP